MDKQTISHLSLLSNNKELKKQYLKQIAWISKHIWVWRKSSSQKLDAIWFWNQSFEMKLDSLLLLVRAATAKKSSNSQWQVITLQCGSRSLQLNLNFFFLSGPLSCEFKELNPQTRITECKSRICWWTETGTQLFHCNKEPSIRFFFLPESANLGVSIVLESLLLVQT